MLKLRNDLEKCVVDVSNAFHKLVELSPDSYDEYIVQLTQCESTNRSTLRMVTEALRSLETKSLPKSKGSHKSGQTSNSSHRVSSHKSHSSKHEKSVASMKMSALANAAALRTKLKYLDAENEQKAKLEKLKTMRDLEIEEAKCLAFSDVQISNVSSFQLLNNDQSVEQQTDQIQTKQSKVCLRGLENVSQIQQTGSWFNVDVVSSQEIDPPSFVVPTQINTKVTTLHANDQCPVITACNSLPRFYQPAQNICSAHSQIQTSQSLIYFNDTVVPKQLSTESAVSVNVHNDPIPSSTVQQSSSIVKGNCREQHYVYSHLTKPNVNNVSNSQLNVNAQNFVPQRNEVHEFSRQIPIPSSLDDRCEYVSHSLPNNPSSINHSPEPSQLNSIVKSFNQLISLNRLKPSDPGKFFGDPLQYPSWRNAFRCLVDHTDLEPLDKLQLLKDSLGGEAKQCVENYFIMPSDDAYSAAIELIDKRYGSNFIIAQAFKEKIQNWNKIGAKDYNGLREFSDFLRQCEVAYRSNSSLKVLDDDLQNRVMVGKLPDWIVSKWARVVHKAKNEFRYPTFSEFVSFLVNESDIVCDPIVSFRSLTDKKGSHNSKSVNLTVAGTSCNTVTESMNCLYCNKDNHSLDRCFKLKGKPYEDKKEFIISKGLCFGCLKGGHLAKECKKRLKCADCNKSHPTVMHGEKPKDVQPENNTGIKRKDENDDLALNKDGKSEVKHTSFLTNDHQIQRSSMIVLVYVSHHSNSNHEILTYALLDSQSDTSFISEDLCNRLSLTGTPVNLRLSTMTSEYCNMASKRLTGLKVRGFDCDVEIPLHEVYKHSKIPANRDSIPTPEVAEYWPYLKPMINNLMPKADCSIGLLIGYNCPRALMPREVIPSQGYGPYAQRTDLGWGVIGPITRNPNMEIANYGCYNTSSNVSSSFIVFCTRAKEIVCPRDENLFKRGADYRDYKQFSIGDQQ